MDGIKDDSSAYAFEPSSSSSSSLRGLGSRHSQRDDGEVHSQLRLIGLGGDSDDDAESWSSVHRLRSRGTRARCIYSGLSVAWAERRHGAQQHWAFRERRFCSQLTGGCTYGLVVL